MKLFNRRSAQKEPTESLASRIRHRSRSRPRQPVAAPQDDPLTSAYSQPTHDDGGTNGTLSANGPGSSGHSRISGPAPERYIPDTLRNGMPKEEGLPGQAITIDNDNDLACYSEEPAGRYSTSSYGTAGRSHALPRHKSVYTHPDQAHSQSSRFEEDVAERNVKHSQGIPPVPPIPQSNADAHTQRSISTNDTGESNPIASEVRVLSLMEKEKRAKRKSKFSSASYYMRQSSPPPTFSQLHDV